MITAAAGMASCGKIPFAYTIGSFLAYRSYEFIRLDVCLQKLNVKIVGIGAGVTYGYLGPTHHTTEDIAVLRSLPDLTLLSPATPAETRALVQYAYEINGPVYIRLGNNLPQELYADTDRIVPGRINILKKGKDIAILATGEILYEVVKAAEMLECEYGIEAEIISVHTLKPLDADGISNEIKKYKQIFSVEEHNVAGGLGSAVAEVMGDSGYGGRLTRIGFNDCFAKGYGTRAQVLKANGLDALEICRKIREAVKEGE